MVDVNIGELRDRISHFVRRAAQGERIVIRNRNREVAVLVPFEAERTGPRRLLGCLEKSARVVGDLVQPCEPPDAWFKS